MQILASYWLSLGEDLAADWPRRRPDYQHLEPTLNKISGVKSWKDFIKNCNFDDREILAETLTRS